MFPINCSRFPRICPCEFSLERRDFLLKIWTFLSEKKQFRLPTRREQPKTQSSWLSFSQIGMIPYRPSIIGLGEREDFYNKISGENMTLKTFSCPLRSSSTSTALLLNAFLHYFWVILFQNWQDCVNDCMRDGWPFWSNHTFLDLEARTAAKSGKTQNRGQFSVLVLFLHERGRLRWKIEPLLLSLAWISWYWHGIQPHI